MDRKVVSLPLKSPNLIEEDLASPELEKEKVSDGIVLVPHPTNDPRDPLVCDHLL